MREVASEIPNVFIDWNTAASVSLGSYSYRVIYLGMRG